MKTAERGLEVGLGIGLAAMFLLILASIANAASPREVRR